MSRRNCCVVGCHNTYKNTRNCGREVYFYSFPSENLEHRRDLRFRWTNAVRRQCVDGNDWVPGENTRICSDHFIGGCRSNVETHPAYVPTIFPGCYKRKVGQTGAVKRFQRLHKRSRVSRPGSVSCDQDPSTPAAPEECVDVSLCMDAECQVDFECPSQIGPDIFVCNRLEMDGHCSAEVQINVRHKTSIEEKGVHCSILSASNTADVGCGMNVKPDDPTLCQGFHWYSSLQNDPEALKDIAGVTLTVFHFLLQLLPDIEYRKLSLENKLLLFLVKLKTGLTNAALAAIFNVHKSTVSRTFNFLLIFLSQRLKNYVYWPSRYAVRKTLPDAFKTEYSACRAIIDCTEVKIECPRKVEHQNMTYSHYKGTFTFKFLVACTPSGLISFVSKCYGGRSSDSYITVNSGILDLLEPRDLILADKGFPSIRTEVEGRQAIFVMPPFLRTPQFTPEETSETKKIASVRIHIERCIQKISLQDP